MSTPTTSQPAGWYPDPQSPAQARYWDGQQWTGQTQPIGMIAQGGSNSPAGGVLGGPGLKEGLTHEQREARDKAQSRGKALTILLGLAATIMTIDAVMSFMLSLSLPALAGAEAEAALNSGARSGPVLIVLALPLILAALVWAMWQFAAAKTLGSRVAKGPAWHAASWFVPVAGPVVGVVNMFRLRRATTGPVALWAGWATCFVLPFLVAVWYYVSTLAIYTKSFKDQIPVAGAEMAPLVMVQSMGSLVWAIGGFLAILVVRHVTAALAPADASK